MKEPSLAESTKDIIRDYLVRTHLNGDSRDFDNETNLLENRILDSFSVLELIIFLDSTFSVKIRPEQMIPENIFCTFCQRWLLQVALSNVYLTDDSTPPKFNSKLLLHAWKQIQNRDPARGPCKIRPRARPDGRGSPEKKHHDGRRDAGRHTCRRHLCPDRSTAATHPGRLNH